MQNPEFYLMFTGIVEALGSVREITSQGTNRSFWIESPISTEFKIDQSISHDGVCLTVEEISGNAHRVTAVDETLKKTNLGEWRPGMLVNLERSLQPGSRLDGHFVQGHVDDTGICREIKNRKGSYEYRFRFSKKFADLVIEKGSIAINGISLTAFEVRKRSLKVAIIPYTYAHTNLQHLTENQSVNIEFDLLGKYIQRKLALK